MVECLRYRRADVAGGTYFFTVNLAERKRTLLVEYIDALRMVMKTVRSCRRRRWSWKVLANTVKLMNRTI